MSRATSLADRYTMAELVAKQRAIMDDPSSLNPAHLYGKSIWIYTPNANKRLDDLAWAITYKLAEAH